MIFVGKKKKIEINNQELGTTTLLTLKSEKKVSIFSILWIVIIFAILIFGVFYLPDIAKWVNSYINPSANISENNNTTKPVDSDNEEEEKEKYEIVDIKDESKIVVDNLTFTNFSLVGDALKFKVKNDSEEAINLADQYYYIQLYSASTLLERIRYNEGVINAGAEAEITIIVSEVSSNKIGIAKITPDEYLNFVVDTNENGVGRLSCINGTEEIIYQFRNNKLNQITNVLTVVYDELNHDSLVGTYTNTSVLYNNMNGVSSVLEDNDILKMTTVIDLTTADIKTVGIKNLYSLGTESKIVKFELEASGYKCS